MAAAACACIFCSKVFCWLSFAAASAAALLGLRCSLVLALRLLLLLLLHCVRAAGEKATVWAFNFFFYNNKMKRILYIGVKALSKTAAEEEKVRGALGRA